jgi:hypothetical protein
MEIHLRLQHYLKNNWKITARPTLQRSEENKQKLGNWKFSFASLFLTQKKEKKK